MKANFMRWLLVFGVLILSGAALAADTPKRNRTGKPHDRRHGKHGGSLIKEAEQVKEEIQQQVVVLARWTPLGWDIETIDYLYTWLLSLPLRIPSSCSRWPCTAVFSASSARW